MITKEYAIAAAEVNKVLSYLPAYQIEKIPESLMDGDQLSVKGIFSQEANEECDRIVNSKANILDINGSNVRKSTNECIQTLYTLTKDPKKK